MSTKTVTIYGISDERHEVPRTLSEIAFDEFVGDLTPLTPLDRRNPNEIRYVRRNVPIERLVINGSEVFFAMTPQLRLMLEAWADGKVSATKGRLRCLESEHRHYRDGFYTLQNKLRQAEDTIASIVNAPWYVRVWRALTGYEEIVR